jgi:hypothetical protein
MVTTISMWCVDTGSVARRGRRVRYSFSLATSSSRRRPEVGSRVQSNLATWGESPSLAVPTRDSERTSSLARWTGSHCQLIPWWNGGATWSGYSRHENVKQRVGLLPQRYEPLETLLHLHMMFDPLIVLTSFQVQSQTSSCTSQQCVLNFGLI